MSNYHLKFGITHLNRFPSELEIFFLEQIIFQFNNSVRPLYNNNMSYQLQYILKCRK
jgi:hypothetical protein